MPGFKQNHIDIQFDYSLRSTWMLFFFCEIKWKRKNVYFSLTYYPFFNSILVNLAFI